MTKRTERDSGFHAGVRKGSDRESGSNGCGRHRHNSSGATRHPHSEPLQRHSHSRSSEFSKPQEESKNLAISASTPDLLSLDEAPVKPSKKEDEFSGFEGAAASFFAIPAAPVPPTQSPMLLAQVQPQQPQLPTHSSEPSFDSESAFFVGSSPSSIPPKSSKEAILNLYNTPQSAALPGHMNNAAFAPKGANYNIALPGLGMVPGQQSSFSYSAPQSMSMGGNIGVTGGVLPPASYGMVYAPASVSGGTYGQMGYQMQPGYMNPAFAAQMQNNQFRNAGVTYGNMNYVQQSGK